MIQLLKYKWVIIAVVVVIILGAVYFVGRGDGTTKIKSIPLPSDVPGSKISDVDGVSIRSLSVQLFESMDGINSSNDPKPLQDLLNLSDTLFVAVYNDFNTLYAAKEEGTLRDWIKGEGGFFSMASGGYAALQTAVLSRMAKLNLL